MSQAGIASDDTSPAADVETLTGNTGGAVGPDGAYNIDVVGDGEYITVAGDPGANSLTINYLGDLVWEEITTNTITLESFHGYWTGASVSGASDLDMTLPTSPTEGDLVQITIPIRATANMKVLLTGSQQGSFGNQSGWDSTTPLYLTGFGSIRIRYISDTFEFWMVESATLNANIGNS